MRKISLSDLTLWFSIISFVSFLILRILLIFSYDSDLGGVENNVIYSICKVLDGGLLYDNPEIGNFNISQYSPLYYYFPIIVGKLFHLNPLNDLYTIYIVGRTFSLIFNLFGAWIIFKLLQQVFKVNNKISFIAVSVYFVQLTRIQFSARPDSLFNLFTIIVIFFLIKFLIASKNKSHFIYLLLALFFASLSVFVKQSGIQFLIIIPFFFLLAKQYKTFISSSSILFVFTSLIFLIFYGLYGHNLILNTVFGLNNGSSFTRLYDVYSHFFLKYQLFIVLGVFLSFYFLKSDNKIEFRFLGYITGALFLFALITSIKEGSWINYYNEFVVMVIISTAVVINKLSAIYDQYNAIIRNSAIIFCLYIIVLLPNIITHKLFHEHLGQIKMSQNEYDNRKRIAKILNDNLKQGQYFLAFDNQINAMLPLKCVVPNKDIVPLQSKFNYTNFDAAFNNKHIKYIVYPTDRPFMQFMGHQFSSLNQMYHDKDYVILESR